MTTSSEKTRRPRLLRIGLWICVFLTALIVGIWVLGATTIGRTIYLAPWVKSQLSTQFSNAIPNGSVQFEGATILIEDDWHPHVVFERLDIVPEDGGPLVSLSEVAVSLSYRKLLRGQLAPRQIQISGVFLTAQRSETGEISLAFDGGAGGANVAKAPTSTPLSDIERGLDALLSTPTFEQLSKVSMDAVTLQFDDRRAQHSWTVDGGSFRMDRLDDLVQMSTNVVLLGGRDYVSNLEFNFQSLIGASQATLGISFQDVPSEDIASQSPALTWLEILQAPISGALRFEIDENGDLGPLNAALRINEGVLQPEGQVRPVPFQSAVSHFTFDPEENAIRFDELSIDSAWGRVRADGVAFLKDLTGGLPNELWGQFQFRELTGNPAGLFGEAVAIDHAQMDMRLQLSPFAVDIGEFLLRNDDQVARAEGRLATNENGWDLRLDAHMDQIQAPDVIAWWPENALVGTRKWLSENITQGELSDINFALRSAPDGNPDIYLDFKFDEADIRFQKDMPPLQNARGQAVWSENRFVVRAAEGEVNSGSGGVLDVAGTSFLMPDMTSKPMQAEVDLKVQGTVTAALALIDHAPLNVLRKAGLPVNLADGQTEVSGLISLPLVKGLKPKDVHYDIAATAFDVRSTHFVPGKTITAPRLDISVTSEAVSVGGSGRIGSLPISAQWFSKMGPEGDGSSQLTGTAELSERAVDEFDLGLSREMVSGLGTAQYQLKIEKGKRPVLSLQSDTRGLDMAIPALGWFKSKQKPAELALEIVLDQPARITAILLNAPGLFAQGDMTLRENGGLNQLRLPKVSVGSWFNGSAILTGRPGQEVPSVEITQGELDIRALPDFRANAQPTAASTSIVANLTKVTLGRDLYLSGFGGSFVTAGQGLSGQFRARVNGGGAINGSISPARGASAISIASADAGAVLRGAGLLKNASGGDLSLLLLPAGQDEFDGQLKINNIRIQDAPAFAELLNAVSVVGLLDQLGGEGILFSDVDSNFRLSQDRITVAQGSAVGPSMGLSLDGVYDLKTEVVDMQGVMSPLYVLNAIGRPISRRGEGLFGFNYALRGKTDNLSVSVNPLSVLTPGIFRDIFRRSPPKLDTADE